MYTLCLHIHLWAQRAPTVCKSPLVARFGQRCICYLLFAVNFLRRRSALTDDERCQEHILLPSYVQFLFNCKESFCFSSDLSCFADCLLSPRTPYYSILIYFVNVLNPFYSIYCRPVNYIVHFTSLSNVLCLSISLLTLFAILLKTFISYATIFPFVFLSWSVVSTEYVTAGINSGLHILTSTICLKCLLCQIVWSSARLFWLLSVLGLLFLTSHISIPKYIILSYS